jgi:hypothetical protein
MLSNLFDGQIRTQGKDVVGQPLGNPLSRIDTVKLFNGIATPWASHGSISNPQSGLGINTIKISHHPFVGGVDPFNFLLTAMTDWMIAFIRLHLDGYKVIFFIKGLFYHLDSTKIKEWVKLDLGHRLASSGLVFLIQILYPEKQAVSIFFGIIDQRFGRRTN